MLERPFRGTFGHAYPPLNSANLSFLTDVTLHLHLLILHNFRILDKGQIISKRLLVSSDSSKKRTNEFVLRVCICCIIH